MLYIMRACSCVVVHIQIIRSVYIKSIQDTFEATQSKPNFGSIESVKVDGYRKQKIRVEYFALNDAAPTYTYDFICTLTHRYFTEGALDIYDCPVVLVSGCVFEHNGPVMNTLKTHPFRSHSGGLSIGCHNINLYNNTPMVIVQNCLFVNNSANPSENLTQSSSTLFQKLTFTGRGGAFGLQLSEYRRPITAVVDNCMFINNSAYSFGGAVYILSGVRLAHTVTVSHCSFIRNSAHSGGGGLLGAFFGAGQDTTSSFLKVSYSLFQENMAPQGGGSSIILPRSGILTYTLYYRFRMTIYLSILCILCMFYCEVRVGKFLSGFDKTSIL